MEPSGWDIANTIAQAVSALGTLAAVIVALWLARHQASPRLRVRNGIYKMIQPGAAPPVQGQYFQVAVANKGYRDVVINGIGWRVGRFRKQNFFQVPPNLPFSATVPKKLQPAEEALFLFRLEDFLKGSESLRSSFGTGRLARWRGHTARVGVWLSTGEECYVPADKTVLDEMFRLMKPK